MGTRGSPSRQRELAAGRLQPPHKCNLGSRKTATTEIIRDRPKLKTPEGEALFDGEIEVDESYFGGNRKGRRG